MGDVDSRARDGAEVLGLEREAKGAKSVRGEVDLRATAGRAELMVTAGCGGSECLCWGIEIESTARETRVGSSGTKSDEGDELISSVVALAGMDWDSSVGDRLWDWLRAAIACCWTVSSGVYPYVYWSGAKGTYTWYGAELDSESSLTAVVKGTLARGPKGFLKLEGAVWTSGSRRARFLVLVSSPDADVLRCFLLLPPSLRPDMKYSDKRGRYA
jgi:hypothetical protein